MDVVEPENVVLCLHGRDIRRQHEAGGAQQGRQPLFEGVHFIISPVDVFDLTEQFAFPADLAHLYPRMQKCY
ncbi:hypothetical protein N825_22935 [Skermanella stibiiresistens SB22]|uniref:Uncharacterized protein n=1 Tax=Skermanella stibiiresistens SB22 TaxID=1385369 RepID=W9GWE2_9PROT|nr:hypothetical protein N825_22935 [Skermanella stibiiresistens SB22]